MTEARTIETRSSSRSEAPIGRLFVLEVNADRIHSMNTDGSDKKTIVTGCRLPDGIAVDVAAGHIYWTNMGSSPAVNDGSIERADIDGKNRKVIVPPGGTFTPKQIQLDKRNGKLYWCDREGMRVMRSNLDGSQIETLVETGRGDADRRDQTRWCVGITIDPEAQPNLLDAKRPGQWKPRPASSARASEIPKGETAAKRTDIEVFFDQLPEPIDLELDLKNRVLYWTDRGDPPRGNTVNRASIDAKPQAPEIVITHSDGRDRHSARRPARSHVRDRFRRFALFRQARRNWRTQFPLRARQSHRHRLHGNLKSDQKENHNVDNKAYSPHSHHRHGRDRRELDRAVSRQGAAGRCDGHRAECRSLAEKIR